MHYHILPTFCEIGSMYYDALFLETPVKPLACIRSEALCDLLQWLEKYRVSSMFSYNANFDRTHLPELKGM